MKTTAAEIAELELRLAGMEKPHDACKGTGLDHDPLSDDSPMHGGCMSCGASGVVPLVAEWQRDCYCKFGNSCRECFDKHINASPEEPFIPHKDWCRCAGRTWVPDLSMEMVLAWMLHSGSVLSDLKYDEETYEILWLLDKPPDTKYNMFAKGNSLEEAVLQAAIAGAEAMAKEVSDVI